MVIDQRNAGASVSTGTEFYTVDRWKYTASVSAKLTVGQNLNSVTPPAGFTNYLGVSSLSSYSISSTDYFILRQFIEGYNIADMNQGSANAKTFTLSFWVRSSLTGTFGGTIANGSFNRSYPFSYTISSANTWEQKSITIAGDTTGTWVGATNGIGMILYLSMGAGSTYSGTANAWQAGIYLQPTGSTSVVGTNGATFYITGVQLEVGSTATSFDYRPITTELALCQRYYTQSTATYTVLNTDNTFVVFKTTMRATPTVTASAGTISGGSYTGVDYFRITGNTDFTWTASAEL
jgi:hypothetical protein